MRIRDDFHGSVYAHTAGGVVVLTAGGEVPDGAQVDAGLLDPDSPPTTPVKRGGGRARKSE
ncbi:hypothetical protein [Corynebacterium auriscanis]|uniref:Uncharacterized protein n=1 Tax=Corynebacterium auriscanis TaxID=99807 RepID=A0A0A2DG38_9CORY|nr:hypothetical protein [Corynebacterium auriscanis]KGM18148.1 hypothetical protein MA47_09690 [Corynebacterium auriscanis]WJY73226.1 hypothetical protein CAURIC_08065 [Corynebacterium auriscanis]